MGMTERERLIRDIRIFLDDTGISQRLFGLRAQNDPSFVPDLIEGRDVRLSTVEHIRSWMAEQRAQGFRGKKRRNAA